MVGERADHTNRNRPDAVRRTHVHGEITASRRDLRSICRLVQTSSTTFVRSLPTEGCNRSGSAGHAGDPDFDEHHPDRFLSWYGTFFKRYFGWQSLLFVHTVVGIYWLVLDVPMAQIVLLYGGPALLSSLQLFYFGTWRPHCHRADAPFADRHNARSDGFGTLASLATCFHFGYHLEHHHRPDVPWWALPAARRAKVTEGIEKALGAGEAPR